VKVAVVANGEWDSEWGKKELASFDLLVAVDGGGNRIIESGFVPYALIGDLDSISAENLEICHKQKTQIQQFPREKNETDLELALEYALTLLNRNDLIDKVSQEIWLFGATGGRVDHFLGNLALMIGLLKRGYRIKVKDPFHELWLIKGIENLKGEKGQEISLIPISETAVVRTEGLYYPLNQDTLRQDTTRGISNVFLGEDALVEVSQGIVLAVLLNPRNKL
jgi:thiamine pyrophosphokinase